MNTFETDYFDFVIISLQLDKSHSVQYLCLESVLYGFQRLILKLVDSENYHRHVREVVDYNKMSLSWAYGSLVCFFRSLL